MSKRAVTNQSAVRAAATAATVKWPKAAVALQKTVLLLCFHNFFADFSLVAELSVCVASTMC